LRDLTRRLGVSHGAPANHFKDRDALLAALAVRGFERLIAFPRDVLAAQHESAAAALIALEQDDVGAIALERPRRRKRLHSCERI
jgi:AcrR family transcriptional regulator